MKEYIIYISTTIYNLYIVYSYTSSMISCRMKLSQAVAPASQADGLGVTPGWRLQELNGAVVEEAEEKLKSLQGEAEAWDRCKIK